MVGRNTASGKAVPQAAVNGANKSITGQPVAAKPVAEKKEKEKLTFYEALPKGDQPPLGSGINLPPKEKPEPAVANIVGELVHPFVGRRVQRERRSPIGARRPAKPKVDTEAVKYVLQVASFPQPDEAGKLLGKLTQGGYDVYVQQADLGSKGVWYRVFVGPVTGKSKATSLQARIEREFKVKPILRKP